MRIYERLPGRAHAAQPRRKHYDGVIAMLSRQPTAERAHDQLREQQARSLEPERSDA